MLKLKHLPEVEGLKNMSTADNVTVPGSKIDRMNVHPTKIGGVGTSDFIRKLFVYIQKDL